jgi:two-component system, OmpR family, alkaline phosphatase synthesis response regulator PhoP
LTSRLGLRHTKREPLSALLVTLAGSDRIEVDPVLFSEPSTRKITVDPEPTIAHAKKLMIVDDDVEMRTLLAEYFRRLGFEVAEKENAALALQAVTTDRFDCFILDVAMPEMSGIELLKKLRERGIDTPTLFLTAHDLLDDKVAGFEAGADDYLAKPFSPRELEYRVEALLRRGQGIKKNGDEDRLEIGDLVVDRRRHEVSRAGARIDLTPLEFQILDLLASEPGRAWSRNDLLDRVWSTEYEGYQRNIDPHINRLRKKLEADPKNPHYVLTVRGVGYKLNENP